MTIWNTLFSGLRGGWKTHGPNQSVGPGAFDTPGDGTYVPVTADTAMNLSAVHACLSLRSEIIGSLPLHLRDGDKNPIKDHDIYYLLRHSPNSDMTPAEYGSLKTAHVDMFGNSISIIARGTQNKPVALIPADPNNCTFEYNKAKTRKTWKIGEDDYDDKDILHHRGFSMENGWGLPRISVGRQILGAQLSANQSAMLAFKQGLKVGGFFDQANAQGTGATPEQLRDFYARLNTFGLPENNGKWMTLPKGFSPIAGEGFRIKPVDAQLLESRYFGIEEICRLFGVPPQLIGHSNKASSWASSIENINLFFLMYSIMPTLVRDEQRISKKLLTRQDIMAGVQPKYSIQGLLRADMKTQAAMFASALQNGYYNRDEVRDLLERGKIDGGDKYTVQLNMTDVTEMPATDGTTPKQDEET